MGKSPALHSGCMMKWRRLILTRTRLMVLADASDRLPICSQPWLKHYTRHPVEFTNWRYLKKKKKKKRNENLKSANKDPALSCRKSRQKWTQKYV